VFGGWTVGGFGLGHLLVILTLAAAGSILFVAAQTGFLDGPRILANMAVDSWVPHRFAQLSDRLVTNNGRWLVNELTSPLSGSCQGKQVPMPLWPTSH